MSSKKENLYPFASVEDYIDYVTNPALVKEGWNDAGLKSQIETAERREFTGTYTFKEAVTLAREGWSDGLKKITKRIPLLLSIGRSKYRVHDVAGDLPDVGRYIAGQPDSMTRRIVDMGMKKPIIDLLVNSAFLCDVEANAIENRGAAIAVVIDELENAGFTVGLKVCMATGSNQGLKGTHAPVIDIKRPGEAMELDRVVYFTSHPAFFRRLGFAFIERLAPYSQIGGGYGVSRDIAPGEGEIYFPTNDRLNRDCGTFESALSYVKGIIHTARPDLFADEIAA